MDGCDYTVGPYIYDDDDHSISSGYVYILDLRFPDDPSHSDGYAHNVDIFTWSFLSRWLCPYCGFMF